MTDKIDTSPEAVRILNERMCGKVNDGRSIRAEDVADMLDAIRALSARVAELEAERDEQIEWVKALADDVNKAEQRAATLESKLAKVTGALAHEVKRSRRHLAGSTLATLAEITETKENDT